MKISHLLVLGLIAFIVYRLTQTVQEPIAPEPERRGVIDLLQTTRAPVKTLRSDNGLGISSAEKPIIIERSAGGEVSGEERQGADNREAAANAIRTILQRLVAATPAPAMPFESALPPAAAAPGAAATPVPASERDRLRISEARRPGMMKEFGAPRPYGGYVKRHFDPRTVLVETREVGDCIVEDFEGAQRMADGSRADFEAWLVGAQSYVNSKGERRTVQRLMHAAPPLPLWDKFGRPINRDVLPAETIKAAGIHTSTAFERTSTSLQRKK